MVSYKTLPILFFFCLGILFIPNHSFSQGWEQRFSPPGIFEEFTQAPNGDFVACTSCDTLPGGVNCNFQAFRVDPNGIPLWAKNVTLPCRNFVPTGIKKYPGGGFVLFGRSFISAQGFFGAVVRLDNNGNLIRYAIIPSLNTNYFYGMDVGASGQIYVAGRRFNYPWCGEVDSLGNVIWETLLTSVYSGTANAVVASSNGEMVVGSHIQDGTINTQIHLTRMDSTGFPIWAKYYPTGTYSEFGELQEISGGNLVYTGITFDGNVSGDEYLCTGLVNPQGDTIWTQTYPGQHIYDPINISANSWGGYTVCATGPLGGNDLAFVADLDQNGNQLWRSWLSHDTQPHDMITTQDSGIVMAGYHFPNPGPWIARLDQNGNLYSNQITGRAFADANADCQYNSNEVVFRNLPIHLDGTTFWSSTDSNGMYTFNVDTGSYQVSAATPPGLYWQQSCPGAPFYQSVSIPNPNTTSTGNDFGFEATANCPLMMVGVGSPVIRRCTSTVFTVNYCNQGSADASAAYMEITLDTTLTLDTSSIPVQSQTGNTYTFFLGNVPIGTCRSFTFNATASCNAPFGLTHCVDARIFPDTLCLPTNPNWNGASVAVEGTCDTDSVRFTLRNVGTNAMTNPGGYVILEDNILRVNKTMQLNAGDSMVVAMPANGSTWIIQAQQVQGHPGQSAPMAFVEACGTNSLGEISTGFATQIQMDDLNPFVDIYCLENIGSWDPNDKRAFPGGIGEENNIFQSTQLEYMIRFQNTGTDTAFRVVIRDTMSGDFDLGSLQLMGSSHSNTFRIYGNRILEWTFDGIMLPDSNVDLAGSQGWVKFQVQREGNLPTGTRIDNDADIYFDYNVPVETEVCFVTIGELIWGMVSVDPPVADRAAIKVYPNPFRERVIFEAGQPVNGAWKVEVYDLSGRKVREESAWGGERIELMRGNLGSGLYLFKVSSEREILGTGKIIIK